MTPTPHQDTTMPDSSSPTTPDQITSARVRAVSAIGDMDQVARAYAIAAEQALSGQVDRDMVIAGLERQLADAMQRGSELARLLDATIDADDTECVKGSEAYRAVQAWNELAAE